MRPDISGLETFACLNIKLSNFEAIVLLSKATRNRTSNLWLTAIVSLTKQITDLKNSSKNCDCLILVCFTREQMHTDATFSCFENKVWLENAAEWEGKLMGSSPYWKVLRKRQSTREVGRNTGPRFAFLPTLLSCSTASWFLYNSIEHSPRRVSQKTWVGCAVRVPKPSPYLRPKSCDQFFLLMSLGFRLLPLVLQYTHLDFLAQRRHCCKTIAQ